MGGNSGGGGANSVGANSVGGETGSYRVSTQSENGICDRTLVDLY